MNYILFVCSVLTSVKLINSAPVQPAHQLNTFVKNINSEYGIDSRFVKNLGFKYNQVFNTQLQYQIITAFNTFETLKATEHLQASLASVFNKVQTWHFLSFVLLLIEIMLLVVMIVLKVSKIKNQLIQVPAEDPTV